MTEPLGLLVMAAVAFIAGAINSVAGGGTILTFPTLAAILPASAGRLVIANATSTMGLFPGAIAAAWAYRSERTGQPPWAVWLMLPCLAGAAGGAWLLTVLPAEWFGQLVPWLILAAAVLFTAQPVIARAAFAGRSAGPRTATILAACVLQFFVSLYGGYFGAGIGIVMLAMLGSLGLGDIHRLNAVKNVLGMLVNGTAAVLFAGLSLAGLQEVSWPHVGVMAVASAAGGLSGSHLARRTSPRIVRRVVAAIAFALAAYYFWAR